MATYDPHSFTDDAEPEVRALELDLKVDFEARRLEGTATLRLEQPARGRLTLDSRGLEIERAVDSRGRNVRFELGPSDPIKGQPLLLALEDRAVTIHYRTGADAVALQWLEPAQTAGGKRPYVFTQCQPIHARTIVPCQDSPRVRVTYRAQLDIPDALQAVMAARSTGRAAGAAGRAVARFEMPQPIPMYLFAFAVGDLASRELGPRSLVYAEPSVVEAAAWEFAGVNAMVTAAEKLFGPYDWERFDLLLMPPSFPYGGMENPRLTFLTPTLLAGDRSLANVVAHELAHSWTGNLVTNATMNDFWLNEGFTTYAERRLLEVLEGPRELSLHRALGRRGLSADIARFGEGSPFSRLRNRLDGIDPDQVYSRVPYEKGCLFLERIEQIVGRPAFDRFLHRYIQTFRFRSVTTEDFLRVLRAELPDIDRKLDLLEWIDGPGVPAGAPEVRSEILDEVEAVALGKRGSREPSEEQAKRWSPSEWQVYLSALPRELDHPTLIAQDARFHFASAKNAEIRLGWLTIAARSGFEPAYPAIRRALAEIGRMKYLRPLYVALLAAGGPARQLAVECFRENRGRYHPVAQAVIGPLIAGPNPPREEPLL
ncbi:MAG: M1 family metallopeptidase [Deltaproteobacteria bacterium]|nr:M1 family metallopeptidase [Deltaproteobacteria bacterium]